MLKNIQIASLLFAVLPGVAHAADDGDAGMGVPTSIKDTGMHVGPFDVSLEADGAVFFQDNVYASETGKQGDVTLRLAPRGSVQLDRSRFKLNLAGGLVDYRYAKFGEENHLDWNLNGNVQLEAMRQTFVRAKVARSRSYEERGSPDDQTGAKTPTPFDITQGELALARDVGKLKANVEAIYIKTDFFDVGSVGGGMITNQDRDRNQLRLTGRFTYKFSPGYSLLLRVAWDRIDYRLPFDDNGVNRDSQGLRLSGGVYFSITNVLDGELFAGFLNRRYDDPRLKSYSAPLYGAALTWSPGKSTRVRLQGDRRLEETVESTYKQYRLTSVNLNADRKISPSFYMTAGIRYSRNEYLSFTDASGSSNRSDGNLGFEFSARKILGRRYTLGASLSTFSRSSPVRNFTRNKLEISIAAKF